MATYSLTGGTAKMTTGRNAWHLFRPTVASFAVTTATMLVALGLGSERMSMTTVVALFLGAIVFVGTVFEGVQGIFAAVFFSIAMPFFFLAPYHRFSVEAEGDRWIFRVFFAAAFGIAFLVSRTKIQVIKAQEKARRADLLYRLNSSLAQTSGKIGILSVSREVMRQVLPDRFEFYVPDGKELSRLYDGDLVPVDEHFRTLPDWVFRNNEPAGRGTDSMNGADALYLPLGDGKRVFGVLSVQFRDPRDYYSRERRELLETVGSHVSAVLEREEHSENGHQANLQMEGERLRTSLLRSISHDLRTPLTSIGGSAEALLEKLSDGDTRENRELLADIGEEVSWLTRMIDNILSLTRFESDRIVLRKESESVEDVVSSALRVLAKRLQNHDVEVRLPETLLLVPMESPLIEQVLVNLVDNAVKYSEKGTKIEVSAEAGESEVVFEVADRGRGIPPEEAGRIFEKFYRGDGAHTRGVRGTGLGLSICRAIVEAHGGKIGVLPREGGGCRFRFTLPLEVSSNG